MSPPAAGLSAERPYPGLRPFAFEDRGFFFGREDQIFALYRLVSRGRFVAVVGSSGSGKSSLVRAGLRGLLADETAEAKGKSWAYAEMRPGLAPLARLAEALAGLAADADPEIANARRNRIEYRLRQSSFGMQDALVDLGDSVDRSILLVIDQFEELFRFGLGEVGGKRNGLEEARRRDEAAQFVQILIDVARRKIADLHVLITMRSDFIGDCSHFHGLPEAVSGTQFLVPNLTRDQLEEAIRLPLEAAGGEIESGLIERLINDCGEELDQLPVLQHCLMRLWDAAGASGATPRKLSRSEYDAIGGMADALSRHADEILAELTGRALVVEMTVRALAEVDREGRATRRALPLSQLRAETGAPDADLRIVLDRFRADDCSFLTPSISATPVLTDDAVLDIGHEALLRRWKMVAGDPSALDAATSRPSVGWLRAEERDGQRYRALISMLDADGRGTPPPRIEEWRAWWDARPRTAAWAERYGGQFENAKRLIDEGVAAQQRAADEKAREQRNTRLRVGALSLALLGLLAVLGYQIWSSASSRSIQAAREEASMGYAHRLLGQMLIEYNEGTITLRGAKDLSRTVENFVTGALGPRDTPRGQSLWAELLLIESDFGAATEDYADALSRAEQAKAIARSLVEKDKSNTNFLQHLYASSLRIGDAFSYLTQRPNHLQSAFDEYRETLSIAQRLAEIDDSHPSWQDDLIIVQFKIGDIDEERHDLPAAIEEYKKSLATADALAEKFPNDPQWKRQRGAAHYRIGQALEIAQDLTNAQAELSAAQVDQQGLVDKNPNDTGLQSNLAATRTRLADVLIHQSKFEEALGVYENGIEMQEHLVAGDPSNLVFKSYLSPNYYNIVTLLDKIGRRDEALVYAKRAFELRKELLAVDRTSVDRRVRFATAATLLGDHQNAGDQLDSYRQALAIWRSIAKSDRDSVALKKLYPDIERVADAFAAQQDWSDARDAYDVAQSIASKNLNDDQTDAGWRNNLQKASSRFAEASEKATSQPTAAK